MCYWKKNSNDKIHTATKDITVYKVIIYNTITKKGFTSRYQDFKYIFGKEYKLNQELFNGIYTSVDTGFHSYSKVNYFSDSKYFIKVKGKKFNSACITDNNYFEGVIVECVIPKGSQYYFNGTDYVSDTLKPICLILPTDEKMFNIYPTRFKKLINDNFKVTTYE